MNAMSLTTWLLGFLLALLLGAAPQVSAARSGNENAGQSSGNVSHSKGKSGQSNGFSDYAVAW
jgi:hypothetical protein